MNDYQRGLDAGLKVAQHVADLIFGPSERARAQRMIERARNEHRFDEYCRINGFRRTGIYANDADTATIRRVMQEASEAPVVKIGRSTLADDADADARRVIDEIAVRYGLPEPERLSDGEINHYGILISGEFVTEKTGPG